MRYAILFVFSAFFAAAAGAQTTSETPAETAMEVVPMDEVEVKLNDFLWTKRPVVVFADTDADPRFQRQMELLSERQPELEARDVVILTDTDPAALSPLREKLRPRGFMLVLIGKDGGVKLRKPFPWDVREISRSIDKMPLRRQELRDQRAAQTEALDD